MLCEEIKIQLAIEVPRINKKLPFVIFAAFGEISSRQKRFIQYVKKSSPVQKIPVVGVIFSRPNNGGAIFPPVARSFTYLFTTFNTKTQRANF